MKTSTPILSELQTKKFNKKAKEFIEGKDLNYQGYNIKVSKETRDNFILDGTEAVKNKVMLWLSSSPGDYVREPHKGGPLWSLLGLNLTEERSEEIKKNISSGFEENFSIELNLVNVKVIPDKLNRRWVIELLVRDPIRRELFEATVGVSV